MPLTAVHADHGRLDATLNDLGSGIGWEQLHRTRPRPPLRCRSCGSSMHAKVSHLGARFFAHDSAAPSCPSHGETVEHQRLKRLLAVAVRAAGWKAFLEAPGDGWRADVLAVDPVSNRRVAWEAQRSPITVSQLYERTARYAAAGVEVCWVTDRSTAWLGSVPSILVAAGKRGDLLVTAGHARPAQPPISDLQAVDHSALETRPDTLVGNATRTWTLLHPDLPPPWLTWPEILGLTEIPTATRLRCRIGWWRPQKVVTLRNFVRSVLRGVLKPVELAPPHRAIRGGPPVVWTTQEYLHQAHAYTAFALGWPLSHYENCCSCSICGDRTCWILHPGLRPDDGLRLCDTCEPHLVDLAHALHTYEDEHVAGQPASPHHFVRLPDSPLCYQSQWEAPIV